ncbi:RNA 3'-terminal phosphate cyclase [Phragmitibacter flavus]|uniref:RNA 3'-terminal phosphate cyclase n=1 Tax=Phragmitibacter flavus TaxID=2576071 RepID=A0A5R8KA25_9BACT|nr:RNA 3'-terminal phosphate cyclase [Phragmitibacter flavus]TLD69146.1 RNA 3'-terminal phosphate cyclase [Phragmitibacter flavus]
MTQILIDGSSGGGQLLRSSLTLSLITGQPFRITRIRGSRPKPGLMRQHLTCVNAAQQISNAQVEGATLGSTELTFTPSTLQSGDYHFSIGTGGSTTLVLQTLLPALLHANAPSALRIEGGTHNPMAPPFEFIDQCYLPLLKRMGAKATVHLEKPGFMQAGGGIITANINPLKKWKPLHLLDRGELITTYGAILHAHLHRSIAERELTSAAAILNWSADQFTITDQPQSSGPGSILLLAAQFEHITEISSSVAQMGRRAEAVGISAAKGLRNFLGTNAAVGYHLADQLLLPLSLAGKGSFTTFTLSKHTQTHMTLIPQFLPVQFTAAEIAPGNHLIKVSKAP